jgi:hypothetical protein
MALFTGSNFSQALLVDPKTSAYVERMLSLVDRDPIAIQQATPELLDGLMKTSPESQWFVKPRADAWSAAEILAHVADAEIVAAFRVRKTISEPGANIAAYAQNAWATALSYSERRPPESLQLFTILRHENLRLYRTLTPEQWEAFGLHSERGRETVRDLVRLIAGHDRNHLAQIEQALRANHS